jgi:SepF-like predicted cell division protein (DUF552 family)
MKKPYQDKLNKQLTEDLQIKKGQWEVATEIILQLISNKANTIDLENQISKRNLLSVDISNIEKQIRNLASGKKQYGEEIMERDISKWN